MAARVVPAFSSYLTATHPSARLRQGDFDATGPMTKTIAFDVYGTLIDPLGVAGKLRQLIGAEADRFASLWRAKQVEYLFRRALMRRYQPFMVCTKQALEFTCAQTGVSLDDEAMAELLSLYRRLPCYPGVGEALERLRQSELRLYAFSNGEPTELEELLGNAGIAPLLSGIVSVHEVESFKPDPAVYAHFIAAAGASAAKTWLVSGNAFDVLGAAACGWRTAWLARGGVFDPWGIEPTAVIRDLGELTGLL